MNTVLEAQTTSTADTSLLQACGSVSTAGKCASKDVARSRLSICTALERPHSATSAAIGSPSPWSCTESARSSLLSCTAPAALAGSALAGIAATQTADVPEAVEASTLQLKRPGLAAASRSSYALVHSELLAASSPKSLLGTASPKPSSDRSSFLNSPSNEESNSADFLGAADGALDKLLSGKISRARTSLVAAPAAASPGHCSTTAAALSGGGAGAAAAAAQHGSTVTVGSSNQLADRSVSTATAAARVSLAHVSLLAAPGVGLLPGSPLADVSAAGAAAAAAMFGGGGSGAGLGRSSAAGSRQQPQQRRSIAAAAASVSLTGGVGGTTSELPQHQQPLLDILVAGATPKNLSGSAALQGPLLQQQHQQQPGTTGQMAAAVHTSCNKKATHVQRLEAAAQPTGCADDSSSHHGTQLGTAAFKATSRAQANCVGRIKVIPPDAPGPAHYRPHHVHTDKHVPAARMVAPSSSRPASPNKTSAVPADAGTVSAVRCTSTKGTQHEQQPQQQNQGQQALTATGLSLGSKAGFYNIAAAVAAAVRGSVTDATPRPADEGPLKGVQPYRVHPKSKLQPGSSAFKAVSRERLQRQQRPASAGAAAVDYFKEGYDSLTRPRSSRGPVPIFAKQTARPASPATSDCPAALAPGSYYRSGNLPISNTGADVPAGHGNSHGSSAHGVPEFGKYSRRPGTVPPAQAHEADQLFAGTVAAGAEWPGLWGWSAAAGGCVSQTGHLVSAFTHSLKPQQHQGRLPSSSEAAGVTLAGKQQPSSKDALAYMRRQCATGLISATDEQEGSQGVQEQEVGSSELDDVAVQQLQRQQLQQQQGRLCLGHQQWRKHHAGMRPATAGAVLARDASTAGMLCTSPTNCSIKVASSPAKQRPSSAYARPNSSKLRPGTGGTLGQQDLMTYSSIGFAPAIKGGVWSTSSRSGAAKVLRAMSVGSVVPPASVAVVQPGTELSYDPNPEVLGHMHRSPGWKLPPNRTATSKKWAQMAARAGLQ